MLEGVLRVLAGVGRCWKVLGGVLRVLEGVLRVRARVGFRVRARDWVGVLWPYFLSS